MVYVKDSKFIAVITHNGKILRDFKNEDDNFQVKLPFGEEYGIRLKNLNTTRVAVSVSVDGQDVLDSSRIVIEPNESHDLEGFMDGDTVKNRFKFIEKTKQISEHRGNKIDDGMIRIEYQFEKQPTVIEKTIIKETIREKEVEKPWRSPIKPFEPWMDGPYGSKGPNPYRPYFKHDEWTVCNSNDDDSVKPSSTSKGITRGMDTQCESDSRRITLDDQGNAINSPLSLNSLNKFNNQNVSLTSANIEPENEDGITVKGSQTNVKYKNAYLKEMEEKKHVMILNITGYKEDKKDGKIVKAVTTTQKITCPTCGHKNKSSNKFCANCGTCLV